MRNRIGRDNLTQWSIKNELRWQSLILALSRCGFCASVYCRALAHEFFIARALVVGEENELCADVHYCEKSEQKMAQYHSSPIVLQANDITIAANLLLNLAL
jgi:hypothetical protein